VAARWFAGEVFPAAVTLVALVVSAAACLITRHTVAAWLLLLFSAAWLPLNSVVEGPVILRLSAGHGIVLADLVAIAGFLLAVTVLWSSHPPTGSNRTRRQRAVHLLIALGIALAGAAVAYQY
jgi:hypothetical protein